MTEKSDSEPIMKVRTSRKLYLPLYILVFILIAVVVYLKVSGLSVNTLALIGVVAFSIISFLFIEIHRLRDLYEINPNSLVHSHGILNKRIKSVDFFAISDSDVSQHLFQRVFNFGNVNVRLFSGKDSATSIKNINNPRKFASFLEQSMNKKRKERGGGEQPE
jgi:uncharacterized membrane protein YdbT with pleckstrin-like domain